MIGTVSKEKEIFLNGKTWFYQCFYTHNGTLEAVTLYDGITGNFIEEFHTYSEMVEFIRST